MVSKKTTRILTAFHRAGRKKSVKIGSIVLQIMMALLAIGLAILLCLFNGGCRTIDETREAAQRTANATEGVFQIMTGAPVESVKTAYTKKASAVDKPGTLLKRELKGLSNDLFSDLGLTHGLILGGGGFAGIAGIGLLLLRKYLRAKEQDKEKKAHTGEIQALKEEIKALRNETRTKRGSG